MKAVPPDNAWFIDAVNKLKGKGIIRFDKELADYIGISKEAISNILASRTPVSKSVKTKFQKFYEDKIGAAIVSEPAANYHSSGTPVYELAATAGQNHYTGQVPESPEFYVNIPGYQDCNFGMFVYGHSMYPTIETGSLILTKRVSDKYVIMYGEIYLIRTADYLMVKRLQKSELPGCVLCTSDNFEQRAPQFKRFEPFDLEIDKIIDLYLVKGIIKKTQS